MKLSLSFTILPALLVAPCSAASAILDQSQEQYSGYSWAAADWRQAQTFTIGITGLLNRIEAGIFPGTSDELVDPIATVVVELSLVRAYDGIPQLLPSDILATATTAIPDANFEQVNDGLPEFDIHWVPFDLGTVVVQRGDQLGIVLKTIHPEDNYWWTADFPGGYAAGDGFWATPDNLVIWQGNQKRDYLFRTYVIPIPEPNTVALLALALLHVGARRSGKRR